MARRRDALLTVAADPVTRSPMRVAEAGRWWDGATASRSQQRLAVDETELAALEARLDGLDGPRPALQARARGELQAEQLPIPGHRAATRLPVLDRTDAGHAA